MKGELITFTDAPYEKMRQLQLSRVTEVAANQCPPTLYIGTHRPVITMGRAGEAANLFPQPLPEGLEKPAVIEVERGGDVTFHGAGQLVGYPIVHLGQRRDLHGYLRLLEEAIIQTLQHCGLKAGRQEGLTGVWVGDQLQRKIASIGIAVRKWVTYHGFALNVSTDLRYFQLLNPCGLQAAVMTSMEKELGKTLELSRIQAELVHRLGQLLEIEFALS